MATTPKFLKKEITDAWKAETWKCALLTCAHTINADTQQTYADVSANEVVGAGYTAGGVTILPANKTSAYSGTNAYLDAIDTVFVGVTITPRYAIVYETAGGMIRQQFDLGTTYPCVGGDLALIWNANGLIKIS